MWAVCIMAAVMCLLDLWGGYEFIGKPITDVKGYHLDILTTNSIFCGFALTNLGILLSISDDQLIKKLEGTDILKKRNTVIVHSIIFGAISIFFALLFVLDINIQAIRGLIGNEIVRVIATFYFYLEIISLCFSIAYFILSIKKMINLLAHIYVPKPKFSEDDICQMKDDLKKERR